jgi:hypothetical protein
MKEPTEEQVQNFIREIMKIERRYGDERKNAKSDRKNDVREYLEKFAAQELDE